MNQRKILHIDMDCFFVAVEIRDNPNFKNKPVAVGGKAHERGVLSTCNYIARRFGLHSAMSTAQALRLCPELIVVESNFVKYRKASDQILNIFFQHTDLVEPLSLDEAFLDVSNCRTYKNSATWIASAIRKTIEQELSLTASAGISVNKFLAKVASDWRKPNGQYCVQPKQVDCFVKNLPVKKIFGVGPKTAEKLYSMNIQTCYDLQKIEKTDLTDQFGKFGTRLYELSRGIDDREVCVSRERKSVSVEHTFNCDLGGFEACFQEIKQLKKRLLNRLNSKKVTQNFKKIFLKIKFEDFTQTTIERGAKSISQDFLEKLLKTGLSRAEHKKVRLLGVGVKLLSNEQRMQLSFDF